MAPIPGTITVNFVSNYAGDHRVAWRLNYTGAYTVEPVFACRGGGAACSTTIAVTVDHETCNDVVFDGYVQACCEDVGSLSGRVPFAVTFSPVQPCSSYLTRCNSVGVLSVTVTTAGSLYDPLNPPAITFSGGGGTNAAATAVVGDGGILTDTITNAGSGYSIDGVYSGVAAVTLTGAGSGAEYTVTVIGGAVTAILVTNPGVDYAPADTISFASGDIGGIVGVDTVVVTVDSVNTGRIQEVTVTNSGSGYTSVPTIVIDPSVGDDAILSVVMEDCDSFGPLADPFPVTGCDGNNLMQMEPLELTQSFILCTTDAVVTLPTGYTTSPSGCCYDFRTVQITNDEVLEDIEVTYFDQVVGTYVQLNIKAAVTETICALNNSWYITPSTNAYTLIVGPTCP
jgi:hypothetical protein